MKSRVFKLCFVLATLSAALQAKSDPSFLLGAEEPAHIVVNNRILAKVNGKAISVIDLMKKMDILFYREFPQYTSSAQARYQFYQANWKHVFQEMVDKELIVADAEENKLPVSSGDVRQEMEQLFGPNIIGNLDKVGLTFDDAWKIVQGDILIRRMIHIRVNTKAMRCITPQDVRAAYEEFAKTNIRSDEWTYQVVTIRDKDPSTGAQAANIAYQMLTEDSIALADVPAKIKELPTIGKTSNVNISEEYRHNEKEVSPAYKEILVQLGAGQYSRPSSHKSRTDNSTVFRIFYLKEMIPGGAIPYNEVENKLKDKLLGDGIVKESKAYIKRLRRHFDVQEMITEDFQPFSIKTSLR